MLRRADCLLRRQHLSGPCLAFRIGRASPMLVADKLNVESSLRVRMLQIREREFDLFLDRIRTIGTLATVLAGLGHAGLLYTKYIDHNLCGTHEGFCAELTYPFFTCIALGASIITMWGCVLLVTQARARHPRRFPRRVRDASVTRPPTDPGARRRAAWPPRGLLGLR